MRVDLNADLGEGAGTDEELLRFVTSANVACGAHAGDDATMRTTVAWAQREGVAIGAHPGFADREHFGRREWRLSREEIVELVRRQVERLAQLAPLAHVKPHGALYNLAARDRETADAVAEGVARANPALRLVGASGSELLRAGRRWGLPVASEVFADRAYAADGSLVPRSQPGALIADPARAAAQVLRMLREGVVEAVGGTLVPVQADTVCVHGDGPQAVEFAQRLRQELADAGIAVRAL